MSYTDLEFANKIDWEGGILEALFDYGLSSDTLDNTQGELFQSVQELEMAWKVYKIQELVDAVQNALDEISFDDEEAE